MSVSDLAMPLPATHPRRPSRLDECEMDIEYMPFAVHLDRPQPVTRAMALFLVLVVGALLAGML